MRRGKLWQRFLAGILSISMVSANLSVGGMTAYAVESETAAVETDASDVQTEVPDVQVLEADEGVPVAEEAAETNASVIQTETEAPAPVETEAPAPAETEAPDQVETEAPAPAETEAPALVETETPAPAETEAPAPVETETPAPVETEAPVPAETEAPAPVETEAPAETETPAPVETEAPTETESEIQTETEKETAADVNTSNDAAEMTVLTQGVAVTTVIAEEGEEKWFQFTPEKSGTYTFASLGKSDTRGALYTDPAGTPVAENDDDDSSSRNFQIDYDLTAGETYYLKAGMCYEYITGSFQVQVSWKNYAIDTISFVPKTTVYYTAIDQRIFASDVLVNVRYTNGTEEQVFGYSSVTDEAVTVECEGSYYNYNSGNDELTPGTWPVKVSYMGHTETYEIQIKGEEEIPGFPADGHVAGTYSEREVYRLTSEISRIIQIQMLYPRTETDWYVNVYDSDRESLMNSYRTGSINDRINYSKGEVFLEKGQNYYVVLNSPTKTGISYDLYASIGQEPLAEETVHAGKEVRTYILTLEESSVYRFTLSQNGFVSAALYDDNGTIISNWYDVDEEEGFEITSKMQANLTAGVFYQLVVSSYLEENSWKLSVKKDQQVVPELPVLEEEGAVQGTTEDNGVYLFTAKNSGIAYFTYEGTGSDPELSVVEKSSGNYVSDGSLSDYSGEKAVLVRAVRVEKDQQYEISVKYDKGTYTLSETTGAKVKELTIASLPDKTTFLASDYLNLSGLSTEIHYADGTSEKVNYGNKTSHGLYIQTSLEDFYEEGVDGNNVLKAGTHTAVISYLGKSAEVELTVVDKAGEDQGTLNVDTPVHKEESQENMESIKHSYAFLPEKSGFYSFTFAEENDNGALVFKDSEGNTIRYNGKQYYAEAGKEYRVDIYLNTDGMYNYYSYDLTVSDANLQFLNADGEEVFGKAEDGEYFYYGFQAPRDGEYRFQAENPEGTDNGWIRIYSKNGWLEESSNGTEDGGMTKWKTVGLAAGEVYLAQIYEDPGVVFVSVSEQNTADAVPMEEDGTYQVDIEEEGGAAWFSFTPEEDGEYSFFSSWLQDEYGNSIEYDTYAELYAFGTEEGRIAYNDDDGEEINFKLTYPLKKGVTYYFKARMLSSTRTGSFLVHFVKEKKAASVEIAEYPQQKFYTFLSKSFGNSSLTGLVLKVTYEDGTEKQVAYNSSEFSWKTNLPNDRYGNPVLKPGTYQVTVTYRNRSVTYDISVSVMPEDLPVVKTGEKVTGTFENAENSCWSFTPDTDGIYVAEMCYTGTDTIPDMALLDEDGNTVSNITGRQYWDSENNEYGLRSALYSLKGGKQYIIQSSSVTDVSYELGVSAAENLQEGINAGGMLSGVRYLLFTPESQGTYEVKRAYLVGSNTSSGEVQLLDLQGKQLSDQKQYGSYDYSEEDRYVEKWLYELNQGQTYVLMVTGRNMEYVVGAASVSTVKTDGSETLEWAAVFTVEKEGFYQAQGRQGRPCVEQKTTRNGKGIYEQIEGISCDYSRFVYLKPGEYLLSEESDYETAISIRFCGETRTAIPSEMDVDQIPRGEWYAYTVVPVETGDYAFQMWANTYYHYYDFDLRLGAVDEKGNLSQIGSYNYSSGGEGSKKILGVKLEEGKEYLLMLYLAEDLAVNSVTALKASSVSSMEFITPPRQTYFYKIDSVKPGEISKIDSSLAVTYADGTEETLEYNQTSSQTGQSFTITLPEDTPCNSSGYMLPGTYQAEVAYANKKIQIPITIAQPAAMPYVNLDALGQGSYTWKTDEKNGIGYLRFRAKEDGFYNVTLSADNGAGISLDSVYNGEYSSMSFQTSTEYGGNYRLVSTTIYVRGGQSCYLKYSYDNDWQDETTLTISVEKAGNQTIETLTCGETLSFANDSYEDEKWFAFTPEEKGDYILTVQTSAAGNRDYAYCYDSPDSANYSGYWHWINRNANQMNETLEGGKTYYIKATHFSGTGSITARKKTSAVKLELLTEGEIYCSTLPGYVESSFQDLQFKITYADGTTEEMPFGYRDSYGNQKYTSYQGKAMSYTAPQWEYDEDQNIKDQEYTVRFYYDGKSLDVPVIARSIQGMDNAEAEFTTQIAPGKYSYYQFHAENAGYYRFTAKAEGGYPCLDLYDSHMKRVAEKYSDSGIEDGKYYVERIFYLDETSIQEGEAWCLRLGNETTSTMEVTCASTLLSPVTSVTITGYPKRIYYLGMDSKYSTDGLEAEISYEDGSSEVLKAGRRSEKTGLSLTTMLDDNTEGNNFLGSIGTKTITVSYMNESTQYTIQVKDTSEIPELTVNTPYSGTVETKGEEIYVKFLAPHTGFYQIQLTPKTSEPYVTGIVKTVQNSSYANVYLHHIGNDVEENAVYLLGGKTYYLRGCLEIDSSLGEKTTGNYTLQVNDLYDLADGVYMGTIDQTSSMQFVQFTAQETGYYQFVLDGPDSMNVSVCGNSFGNIPVQKTEKDGRKYQIARLQAGSVYWIVCEGYETGDYMLYAGKKPEVKGISIVQQPSKTLYYARFENSLEGTGLQIQITYQDGQTELLDFGEMSSWGVRMTLDESSIRKDAYGRLVPGTYMAAVNYLEQKASFPVEVAEFDPASAETLKAETLTPVTIEGKRSVFYAFTPEETKTYRFYSRGETLVSGAIYDNQGILQGISSGSSSRKNFSVSVVMEKGKTYVLRVRAIGTSEKVQTSIKLHDTGLFTEVESVQISPKELVFGSIGEEKNVSAKILPADAKNMDVTFESSNPEVVSVDKTTGKVTAVSEGTAQITAISADGGYTDTCQAVVDLQNPEVSAIYPAEGGKLGPDVRTIWIYTEDNYGTDHVEISYGTAGAGEQTKTVVCQEEAAEFIIPKADFAEYTDGETVTVSVTAVDKGGLKSSTAVRTYVVDKKAPEIRNLAGVYAADGKAGVSLTWLGGRETDISGYSVYRKSSGAADSTYKYLGSMTGYVNKEDYSWLDTNVRNEEESYTYKVTAEDKYGNSSEYTVDLETHYVNIAPKIVLACAGTMISGTEYTFDLGDSSDNSAIVKYAIDFGDGTVDEGTDNSVFFHTYTLAEGVEEQIFAVKAEVTDDEGAVSSAEKKIRVINLEKSGMLTVHVADTDGIPMANVPVYFNMGEDSQVIERTDRTGAVEFKDLAGFHTVGVYTGGYLPYKTTVELTENEVSELHVTLEKKSLVEGKFESHRMTYDELKDAAEKAGLDISDITNDPANNHVLRYDVKLEYTTLNIYYDGEKTTVVGGGGRYIPVMVNEEIVVILEIPVGVKFLKEFYNVKLYIMNNASEDFSLTNNKVQLNVPDGLTVMEELGAAAKTEIDVIPGNSTETVEWILRGDKSGEYALSAEYSGMLSDFNAPVMAHFESEDKLKVYGVDNLELTMQIPDAFTNGEFYYNLIMKNTAEAGEDAADMYLPGMEAEGELMHSIHVDENGSEAYVNVLPEVLRAGERIEQFYRITDQISNQLAQYPNYKDFVFYFKNAWVKELSSYGVKLNIEVISAEEMAAKYEKYRALPAENIETAFSGAVYGYEEGDAVLTASAVPAANADYEELTYLWFDTAYNQIGSGSTFAIPKGKAAGKYHYHLMVVSTRKDNGKKAETDYQDIVVEIAPKEVQLIWKGQEEREYDGTASNVTASLAPESLLEGDVCTVTVSGGDAVDAGIHTAKAEAVSNSNYTLPKEAECSYTITPKPVTLTWSGNEERVYNGEPSKVEAFVSQESLVEGDTCEVTVENGAAVDAGTYTATAVELSNTNYALPSEKENLTCSYTILPKTVDLVWSGKEERVYNGQPSNVTAAVAAGSLVKDDTCKVTVENGTAVNAGTYTAAAVKLSNTNYVLPSAKDSLTCSYTILPKTIALVWTGNEERVYNGQPSNVTAAVEGLVEGDICEVTVENGTAVDAGTYTAKAVELSSTNYVLPEAEEEQTCSYTITPKTIALVWNGNEERVYNGQPSKVTAAVAAESLIGDDLCEVTVESGNAVNAGNYTAKAAELSNTNYALPKAEENRSCAYVITPKTLEVTWEQTEKIYDGQPVNAKAVLTNLETGDECSAEVQTEAGVNVGTYTASITGLVGAAAGNYQLGEAASVSCQILPREAVLSWNGTSKEYDGQPLTAKAEISNLVEGDLCEVTVENPEEILPGIYTARAAELTGSSAGNYVLPEGREVSCTIGKRQAVLTWSGLEKTYDGAPAEVKAEVSNLVAGDTCEAQVQGVDAVNAGTYTAVAVLDNEKYELAENAQQSYTILPKAVHVIWAAADKTYDGSAAEVTANADAADLVGTDSCGILIENAQEIHAGTYSAKAVGTTNGNYVLAADAETTKAYTIAPKPIALTWKGTEARAYDGNASNVTAEVSGILAGDSCSVTVIGGNEVVPGTYTATAVSLGNGDYELSKEGTTQSYEITKRIAEIGFTGTGDRTYDGKASSVQAVVTNLVSGDTCSVTVTGGDAVHAGTYSASAVSISDTTKYELKETKIQTYTILPKAVTVSWKDTTKTYDGKALTPKTEVTDLAAGDTCKVTAVEGTTRKDAGTYTVTAKGLDNSDYVLSGDVKTTCTILPKTAAFTWKGTAARTYNKKASNVQAAVSNLVAGDTCTVTVTGGKAKDAGTYTAEVTALGNANYEIPKDASVSYTIRKASQTVTVKAKTVTAAAGKTVALKAKASGKGKLTYKSSSTKLATVNTKGTVTGKRAGKVTVTVTAGETKNYKKAVQKVTVYVTPQKMGTAALSSKQKGKLTVKWKKLAGVSGYELEYSTSSKFTVSTTKKVVLKSSASTKTISKLKAGKKYYVRIRAYKSMGGKKYYGAFGKASVITVKKK